jgi:hypothetical protein
MISRIRPIENESRIFLGLRKKDQPISGLTPRGRFNTFQTGFILETLPPGTLKGD